MGVSESLGHLSVWFSLFTRGCEVGYLQVFTRPQSRDADEVSVLKTSRLLIAGWRCLDIIKDLSAAFLGNQRQVWLPCSENGADWLLFLNLCHLWVEKLHFCMMFLRSFSIISYLSKLALANLWSRLDGIWSMRIVSARSTLGTVWISGDISDWGMRLLKWTILDMEASHEALCGLEFR